MHCATRRACDDVITDNARREKSQKVAGTLLRVDDWHDDGRRWHGGIRARQYDMACGNATSVSNTMYTCMAASVLLSLVNFIRGYCFWTFFSTDAK
jgi:hypothetical protein